MRQFHLAISIKYDYALPYCERDLTEQDRLAGALRNAENLGLVIILISVTGFLASAALLTRWRALGATNNRQFKPHSLIHWWALFIVAILFAPAVLAIAAETQYARDLVRQGDCQAAYSDRNIRMADSVSVSMGLQYTVGVLLMLLLITSIAPTFGDFNYAAMYAYYSENYGSEKKKKSKLSGFSD